MRIQFDPLSFAPDSCPFALLSASVGNGGSLPAFAAICLLMGLLALCAFGVGMLAGWFRWSFLADQTIAALEAQNAELRDQLHGPAPMVATPV